MSGSDTVQLLNLIHSSPQSKKLALTIVNHWAEKNFLEIQINHSRYHQLDSITVESIKKSDRQVVAGSLCWLHFKVWIKVYQFSLIWNHGVTRGMRKYYTKACYRKWGHLTQDDRINDIRASRCIFQVLQFTAPQSNTLINFCDSCWALLPSLV